MYHIGLHRESWCKKSFLSSEKQCKIVRKRRKYIKTKERICLLRKFEIIFTHWFWKEFILTRNICFLQKSGLKKIEISVKFYNGLLSQGLLSQIMFPCSDLLKNLGKIIRNVLHQSRAILGFASVKKFGVTKYRKSEGEINHTNCTLWS